jgi:hypothetical protein
MQDSQAMTPQQVQAIVMQLMQDLMTPNTVHTTPQSGGLMETIPDGY